MIPFRVHRRDGSAVQGSCYRGARYNPLDRKMGVASGMDPVGHIWLSWLPGCARSRKPLVFDSWASVQCPRSWPKRRTGSASPSGDSPTPPRPPKYFRHRYWSPGAELTSRTAEETGICRRNICVQNNHNTPKVRRRRGQFRALSRHVPLISSHIALCLCLLLALCPSRLVPLSVVQVRLSYSETSRKYGE